MRASPKARRTLSSPRRARPDPTPRPLRRGRSQHAGRASVNVFTLFFFRERKAPVLEAGYVIGLRERSIVVLVPRYGIEARCSAARRCAANPSNARARACPRPSRPLSQPYPAHPTLARTPPPHPPLPRAYHRAQGLVRLDDDGPDGSYAYDEARCCLRTPFSLLRVFQKVQVSIWVDTTKPHRPRLVVDVVQPRVRRTPAAPLSRP